VGFVLVLFFGSLFLVSDAKAEDVWWAQQINENDWTEVVAPDGWEIAYVRGWYGSPVDGNCGADVSSVLGDIALGTVAFEFVADNVTFGDSCPGVYKVFRFTWGIVPLTVVPEPEPTVVPEPPVDPVDPPVDPVDPPVEPPVEPEPPVVEPEPELPPVVEPEPELPPVVEPEPPVVEPEPELPPVVPTDLPKPEPEPESSILDVDLATVDPQLLSDEDVAVLLADALAVFDSAVQGSAEYEEALDQLFLVAQADDIVVDAALADVPLLGVSVVALVDVVNYLGNVGSDMSPVVRATAEKEVVAAVVVTQAAVSAAGLASVSAGSSFRRKF